MQNKQDVTFEIRRFRPEDEPQLLKAWKEAYPDLFHFKYPARWKWNMFQNPFVSEQLRPLCWVAAVDGEIAAWSCAMAVPVMADGRPVTGGHSVDTFTLERYRCYGLGKKLQELNQGAHALFIAIDPSPPNRRNKYKVGGRPGKPLDTWLLLGKELDRRLLYASFLRLVAKYLGRRGETILRAAAPLGLARLLSLACSAGLRYRQCPQRGEHGPGALKFEPLQSFDAQTDTLWGQAARRYSFAISRSSDYLNWKYVLQPNLSYRKFLIWKNEAPVGLLVYRFPLAAEQPVGIISECFCVDDDPETQGALLAHAIRDFKQHGIHTVKCGASTANQREALKRAGFGLVDIDVPVFHVSGSAEPLDLKALMAKDWLLSLGDSDLDQVRPEHQPTIVEILRILRGRIPGSEHVPQ